jgi:predicted dehydrogenase
LKLALVGCGAIAEFGYLPALPLARGVETILLVDRDLGRAKAMADRFGIPHFSSEVADVVRTADAVCVALPHHLHETIGRQLLDGGVHVLIEKPLAVTTAECDILISSAARNGRILSVAMPRRYSPGNLLAKRLLTTARLGQVRSFHIESGSAEVWPARSTHLLSRRESGGGVLMANGCHDLDLITWLFGPVANARCLSDSLEGAEGNFTLEMTMDTGVNGLLELSRTRTLKNRLLIEAEHARAEFPLLGHTAKITFEGSPPVTLNGRAELDDHAQKHDNLFLGIMAAQLENFAAAIEGREPPTVDGVSARATVELINRCYASACPMELAWRRPIAFQLLF